MILSIEIGVRQAAAGTINSVTDESRFNIGRTFNSSAQVERKVAGLSTCSKTSIEQTTSYLLGCDSRDSAGAFR